MLLPIRVPIYCYGLSTYGFTWAILIRQTYLIRLNLYSNDRDSSHRRRTDHSIVFAMWCQCESASNACILGPTRVCPPNGFSIGSAVFAGLTGVSK